MTALDIAMMMKDYGAIGGLGFVTWLYMQERKENRTLQAERLNDIKACLDTVNKSVTTLDKVMLERRVA